MKTTRAQQIARALTARALARKNGHRDVRVPLKDIAATTTVTGEQVRLELRRHGHLVWERLPKGWTFEYPSATGPSVRVRTGPLVAKRRRVA